MASEYITFNAGPSEKEGKKRRAAYEDAKHKSGARSLSEWIRKILDTATGFKNAD